MIRQPRGRATGAKVAVGVAAGALASGLTGALAVSPASAATVVSCIAGQPNTLQHTMDTVPSGSTIDVTGTCTGAFTISQNLTLQGPAILDGNGSVQSGVPTLTVNPGVVTTLVSLVIENGTSLSSIPVGGGIYNNRGTVTLNSSLVSHNVAVFGGGIDNEDGTVTVNSSSVSDNSVKINGGGIFNDGGTVNVNSSSVSDNGATGVGGGIYNSGGTVNLNSSSVSTNHPRANGGGIYNDGGTLNLTSSAVSKNTARFNGAGIYNTSEPGQPGIVHLVRSSVSANVAGSGIGGGILNRAGSTVSLVGSSVTGNSSGASGGGIYNAGTANLSVSSVTGNTPDNCFPTGSVPGCMN